MKLEIRIKIELHNWLRREHLESLEKNEFGNLDSQIAIISKNGNDHEIEILGNSKFDLDEIIIKYTVLNNNIVNSLIKIQNLIKKINNWDLKYLKLYTENLINELEIVNNTGENCEKNCKECYQYTLTLEKLFNLCFLYMHKYINIEIKKYQEYTNKNKQVLDEAIEKNFVDDETIIELKNNYIKTKDKLKIHEDFLNELEKIELER